MKRDLIFLFLTGCAHSPNGEPCIDRCDYQFPGEGWRWAFVIPVWPTETYNACMRACRHGKTYRLLERDLDSDQDMEIEKAQ